jgi:hypothetical protein
LDADGDCRSDTDGDCRLDVEGLFPALSDVDGLFPLRFAPAPSP